MFLYLEPGFGQKLKFVCIHTYMLLREWLKVIFFHVNVFDMYHIVTPLHLIICIPLIFVLRYTKNPLAR